MIDLDEPTGRVARTRAAQRTQDRETTHRKGSIMTDDRTETIHDRAAIRATDEPDERGDFPCCATPTPVGAAVALDLDAIEAAALADDGWWSVPVLALVAEVRRLTEESEARRVREMDAVDIATTPAPVGAAVELDLDAARAMLNAANTIKATGGAVEIGGVRIEPCDEYGSTVTTARAESAEAEVGTLRAKVAEAEALHWKVGGACSHCSQRSDYAVAWPCETAVALAGTTGEVQ